MKSKDTTCIVCNQIPDQSDTDTCNDIFKGHNGSVLSSRLEKILEARIDSASCHTKVLCQRCHQQVVEIEGYYKVIHEFRHLYHQTINLHKQEENRSEALDSLLDTGFLELEKLLGIDHNDPSVQALLKAESSYRSENEKDTFNSKLQNPFWKDSHKSNIAICDINTQEINDARESKQDNPIKNKVRKVGPSSRTTKSKQNNTTVTHNEINDSLVDECNSTTRGNGINSDLENEQLNPKEERNTGTRKQVKRGVSKNYCHDRVIQSNGEAEMDCRESVSESKAPTSKSEPNKQISNQVEQREPSQDVSVEKTVIFDSKGNVKGEKKDVKSQDAFGITKCDVSTECVTTRHSTNKRKLEEEDTPAKETMKLRRRLPRQASQQVSKATETEPSVDKTLTVKVPDNKVSPKEPPITFQKEDTSDSESYATQKSDLPTNIDKQALSSSNSYICSSCQSGFKTRHDFYRHIRTCGKTSQPTLKSIDTESGGKQKSETESSDENVSNSDAKTQGEATDTKDITTKTENEDTYPPKSEIELNVNKNEEKSDDKNETIDTKLVKPLHESEMDANVKAIESSFIDEQKEFSGSGKVKTEFTEAINNKDKCENASIEEAKCEPLISGVEKAPAEPVVPSLSNSAESVTIKSCSDKLKTSEVVADGTNEQDSDPASSLNKEFLQDKTLNTENKGEMNTDNTLAQGNNEQSTTEQPLISNMTSPPKSNKKGTGKAKAKPKKKNTKTKKFASNIANTSNLDGQFGHQDMMMQNMFEGHYNPMLNMGQNQPHLPMQGQPLHHIGPPFPPYPHQGPASNNSHMFTPPAVSPNFAQKDNLNMQVSGSRPDMRSPQGCMASPGMLSPHSQPYQDQNNPTWQMYQQPQLQQPQMQQQQQNMPQDNYNTPTQNYALSNMRPQMQPHGQQPDFNPQINMQNDQNCQPQSKPPQNRQPEKNVPSQSPSTFIHQPNSQQQMSSNSINNMNLQSQQHSGSQSNMQPPIFAQQNQQFNTHSQLQGTGKIGASNPLQSPQQFQGRSDIPSMAQIGTASYPSQSNVHQQQMPGSYTQAPSGHGEMQNQGLHNQAIMSQPNSKTDQGAQMSTMDPSKLGQQTQQYHPQPQQMNQQNQEIPNQHMLNQQIPNQQTLNHQVTKNSPKQQTLPPNFTQHGNQFETNHLNYAHHGNQFQNNTVQQNQNNKKSEKKSPQDKQKAGKQKRQGNKKQQQLNESKQPGQEQFNANQGQETHLQHQGLSQQNQFDSNQMKQDMNQPKFIQQANNQNNGDQSNITSPPSSKGQLYPPENIMSPQISSSLPQTQNGASFAYVSNTYNAQNRGNSRSPHGLGTNIYGGNQRFPGSSPPSTYSQNVVNTQTFRSRQQATNVRFPVPGNMGAVQNPQLQESHNMVIGMHGQVPNFPPRPPPPQPFNQAPNMNTNAPVNNSPRFGANTSQSQMMMQTNFQHVPQEFQHQQQMSQHPQQAQLQQSQLQQSQLQQSQSQQAQMQQGQSQQTQMQQGQSQPTPMQQGQLQQTQMQQGQSQLTQMQQGQSQHIQMQQGQSQQTQMQQPQMHQTQMQPAQLQQTQMQRTQVQQNQLQQSQMQQPQLQQSQLQQSPLQQSQLQQSQLQQPQMQQPQMQQAQLQQHMQQSQLQQSHVQQTQLQQPQLQQSQLQQSQLQQPHLQQSQPHHQHQLHQQQQNPCIQTGLSTASTVNLNHSISSSHASQEPSIPSSIQGGFQTNTNVATPGKVHLVQQQQGVPFPGPLQGVSGSAGSSHQMAVGVGVGGVGGGNSSEFKAPPAEGGFSCASALVNLAKTHAESKPFPCLQCDTSFFSADMLMEHARVHAEDAASAGSIPGGEVISEELERLSSNATPASSNKDMSPEPAPSPQPKKQRKQREPKSWRCAKCNITCSSSEEWAEHRRSHMGEKAYLCPTCGTAFAAKWYLTRHQRTHSGEKPHKCDICNKAFGRPDHLRKHMTIHASKQTNNSNTSDSPTTSV